jgi:peptide/nickel transport system permease protein
MAKQAVRNLTFGGDERYLTFREFFGLTLPVLFNHWPYTSREQVLQDLTTVQYRKKPGAKKDLSMKEFSKLKTKIGDRARFTMPQLLSIMDDESVPLPVRRFALYFFLRGGTQFAHYSVHMTQEIRHQNDLIEQNNRFLDAVRGKNFEKNNNFYKILPRLHVWYEQQKDFIHAEPTRGEKLKMFFFETRFWRYFDRVLHLDFGVLRSDINRTVVSEVTSRLKYSLTLAVIPLIITFFICQLFGLIMALNRYSLVDVGLSCLFLILYATPVIVVGPFLIEKIALNHNYPFTHLPFPFSGFTSDDPYFSSLNSWQRIGDVFRHITLPLICVFYASVSVDSRLSRAVFIETLHQDYVRTAVSKGMGSFLLYVVHVGRNAAIPICTSIAGSLGIIIGGSVLIETIFDINGFGKFFYDAVLNRDYNVMMFSALVGSFLALLGYLFADISYMLLDPRVNLEQKTR